MNATLQILAGLLPSAGVGFLFFIVIRSLVQAGRRERPADDEVDTVASGIEADRS